MPKVAHDKYFLEFKIFSENNCNSNKTNILERNKDQILIPLSYKSTFTNMLCSLIGTVQLTFIFICMVQNN